MQGEVMNRCVAWSATMVVAVTQLAAQATSCGPSDNVYWQSDSDCSWARAITPETRAAPHAIAFAVDEWPYLVYEVSVSDVQRRVGIHVWQRGAHTGREVAATLAKAYAQLPPFVHRILPRDVGLITHPTGGRHGRYCHRDVHTGCGTTAGFDRIDNARHLIFLPADHFLDAAGEPVPALEEQLLHEVAHLLFWSSAWFRRSEWVPAAERDGGHVTDYAATSTEEDFAESFAAWVLHRAYWRRLPPGARDHIARSMRHRLIYFDRYHRRTTLRQLTPSEREWFYGTAAAARVGETLGTTP